MTEYIDIYSHLVFLLQPLDPENLYGLAYLEPGFFHWSGGDANHFILCLALVGRGNLPAPVPIVCLLKAIFTSHSCLSTRPVSNKSSFAH